MMELSNADLQDFRSRMLQAATYGYDVALADEYVTALAAEVGQEIVPEGLTKASAAHLLALADEALALRASGGKKPKKAAFPPKRAEEPKSEEPKSEEPAKTDDVKDTVKDEEPAKDPEPKKDEEPAKTESSSEDKKKSKKH